MTEVASFLTSSGLGQYVKVFAEHGYDSVDDLAFMKDEETITWRL